MKLNFKKILIQSSIKDNSTYYRNANRIISRFPDAQIQEVDSHWRIPELFEAPSIRKQEIQWFIGALKSNLPYCSLRDSF